MNYKQNGGEIEPYFATINELVEEEQPGKLKELYLFNVNYEITKLYYHKHIYDRALQYANIAEQHPQMANKSELSNLYLIKSNSLLNTNHQEALSYLNKAIDIYAKKDLSTLTIDNKKCLIALLTLRGNYAWEEQGNITDAISYYLRAFDIIKDNDLLYSDLAQNVIFKVVEMAKYSKTYNDIAEKLLFFIMMSASDNNDTERVLLYTMTLAKCYLDFGNIQEAQNTLNICEKFIKPDDNLYNEYCLLRGNIYVATKDYAAAVSILEPLLNKSISQDMRFSVEEFLAIAYSYLGDSRISSLSDTIKSKAKIAVAKQLHNISPRYRKGILPLCDRAIHSLLMQHNNPRAVKNAAELNLFRKSILSRTSTQIKDIVSRIPGNDSIIAQLKILRNQLSQSQLLGSPDRQQLAEQVDSLEQRYTILFAQSDTLLRNIDIDIDNVIAKIPDNGVAIDFCLHAEVLGVFIYSKRQQPIFINLDSTIVANPIALLDKLVPYIMDYDDVYFSADDEYNTIPIELQRHQATGAHRWHRVFHLADIKPSSTIGVNPVIVGVSDYNSPAKGYASVNRGDWTDLPNVKYEVNLITKRLSEYSPTVLLDDNAREQTFKALSGSKVSLLHISTHGFYRDNDTLKNAACNPLSNDYAIAKRALASNKEELSGLVLRYGNLSWKSRQIADDEDDLLLSDEIENLSFPNLKLTVLSACDSGIGITGYDGIGGLQRAFKAAGTQALICSLNKVDDYWSAMFMDVFYENAAQGKSIYDSFHAAQQWIYDEQPTAPEIWSSFILIE